MNDWTTYSYWQSLVIIIAVWISITPLTLMFVFYLWLSHVHNGQTPQAYPAHQRYHNHWQQSPPRPLWISRLRPSPRCWWCQCWWSPVSVIQERLQTGSRPQHWTPPEHPPPLRTCQLSTGWGHLHRRIWRRSVGHLIPGCTGMYFSTCECVYVYMCVCVCMCDGKEIIMVKWNLQN